MNTREIKDYKKNLQISDRQQDIIIGSILGDGHLEFTGKYCRLKTEHSYKQKCYVDWKYRELKNLGLKAPALKIIGKRKSYWFSTLTLPQLMRFHNEFKCRRIPPDVHRYLTPMVLAVWFMDDGSRKSKQCKGLYLQTQSFKGVNLLRLRKALLKLYRLSTVMAQDNRLYFPSKTSARILCQIITPHVHESMKYKLSYQG